MKSGSSATPGTLFCLATIGLGLAICQATAQFQFKLGEDDPGALAGNTGNATTVDSLFGKNLTRVGTPTYSANAAPGGSTLSMTFNGTANNFYTGNGLNFYSGIDLDNFALSLDVYPTAAPSFHIPFAFGKYGSGASFVYHAGGTWRYHVVGLGDQIADELRGDGNATFIFAVLPGIAEVGQHRGDALGR